MGHFPWLYMTYTILPILSTGHRDLHVSSLLGSALSRSETFAGAEPWGLPRDDMDDMLEIFPEKYSLDWFKGKFTGNPWFFTIKYRAFRLKFSHHPIL